MARKGQPPRRQDIPRRAGRGRGRAEGPSVVNADTITGGLSRVDPRPARGRESPWSSSQSTWRRLRPRLAATMADGRGAPKRRPRPRPGHTVDGSRGELALARRAGAPSSRARRAIKARQAPYTGVRPVPPRVRRHASGLQF